MSKSKLILGSIAGSLAIHVAFAACNPPSPGGSTTDAGILDAISGLLDSSQEASADTDAGPDGSGACACSGANADGSRLKLVSTVASDGLRLAEPLVAWDSKLNVLCSPSLMSDWMSGTLYCVPTNSGTSVAWSGAVASTFFTDSSCTHPIGEMGPSIGGTATPKFAEYLEESLPGAGLYTEYQRVWPVTGTASAPTTVYGYPYSGGTCASESAAANATWYALGAELPTSAFVTVAVDQHE